MVLWTVPACVPARGEEELENFAHARETRAGTKAGGSLVVRWWFSGLYPRASPHAENEELENSIHARGTRAGTEDGRKLVVL